MSKPFPTPLIQPDGTKAEDEQKFTIEVKEDDRIVI